MGSWLRLIHILSTIAFLGSIIAYVVISERLKTTNDLTHIYLITSYINFAARYLTIPSMGLAVITGIWVAIQKGYKIFSERWLAVKLVLALLIVSNAIGIIIPYREKKEIIAEASLQKGVLLEQFLKVQRIEDIFGVVNICLILLVVSVSVYKGAQKLKGEA